MSGQADGTVKWYRPEQAYGFITTADGHDLCVQRNALSDGRPWLVDGQEVAFTVRAGLKDSEAADVQVVRDVEAIPAVCQRLYAGGGRDDYGGDVRGDGRYGAAPQAAPRPSRAPLRRPDPGRCRARHDAACRSRRTFPLRARREPWRGCLHAWRALRWDHLRPGDEIAITIERSERGLRARAPTPR